MILSNRIKTVLLLAGDLIMFYLSLYLALSIRTGFSLVKETWDLHQVPFLFIHILWLFVFYISDLYDIKGFGSFKIILKRTANALLIITILSTIIFYFIPQTGIAPKTILFLDIVLVAFFLILWRRLFWSFSRKVSKIKVLFFGSSKEVEELANHLKNNPQIGYEPTTVLPSVNNNLQKIIKEHNIQLIVASESITRSEDGMKKFYEVLPLGVDVVNFQNFYEIIRGKVPLSMINENWFLENLSTLDKKMFETLKRFFDILGAIILGIPTLLFTPIIAIAIKSNSKGPVFYKHQRVGKNGKIFEIIKFRSMIQNAEKNGATWATEKDKRITKIGKMLRRTRLDELPQLLNILMGDLSFIGPRPERPEFVQQLTEKIPHYSMRLLVKPGASGWAQINYRYGSSVEDAIKKLQYDLYYIKNRSIVLDLSTFLKTIMVMLDHSGR
ncbi:exopolysaccharide biosynthesis polyprenyl glycosylphosphotransferase [Patescibacteria group bacterium]